MTETLPPISDQAPAQNLAAGTGAPATAAPTRKS